MSSLMMILLLLLLCSGSLLTGGQLLSRVEQISGNFGHVYRGHVSTSVNFLFVFNFVERANITQAVRVDVASSSARPDYPVLFVVRQQRSILSFQVPEILESEYFYSEVARTLCPVERASKGADDKNQTIYIDVSTASSSAIPFTLNVTLVRTFQLEFERVYSEVITPSRPKYFRVAFPPEARHLSIVVESRDQSCVIVSAQSVGCPVYDLVRNVEFTGVYQTMSTKAEITVGRRDFTEESFYIVFVMKPSRHHCSFTRMKDLQPKAPNYYARNRETRSDLANATEVWSPSGESSLSSKTFSFKVTKSLERVQYFLPVFGIMAFFAAFHLAALIILLAHWKLSSSSSSSCCCGDNETEDAAKASGTATATASAAAPLTGTGAGGPASDYGSTADNGSQQQQQQQQRKRTAAKSDDPDTDDAGSGSETFDSRRELRHEFSPDGFEDGKPHRLFVSDLCQKRPSVLRNKYRLYYWYLIIVSIFYGLPVVQLVITYQQILRISGNQDICYYNFYCAHPLGVISAFNNVFSNVGYVILGMLFLGLTRRRDLLDRRRREADTAANAEEASAVAPRGIPQHFGIFYAMGIALIMEGVMSGCYHVCPSYSNFQFDTAYMYVLAVLCMLKIYQTRHPDINATAHVACMSMAIVIFVSVVGVVYGTVYFWAAFTIFFILSSLFLTGEVYYMGHWKVNIGLFRRFYLLISSQGLGCFKPMYKDRMIILVTANIINWAIAIYGAVRQPQDFNSFLLYILLVNLLMYVVFYVVMKVRSGERIHLLPTLFVVLSCITWAAGLYFFMQRPSNWANSPAESRALNQRCLLLGFYDVHDIWHFLSSMSLFFSFMVLLSLDDDLVNAERDQIPVF